MKKFLTFITVIAVLGIVRARAEVAKTTPEKKPAAVTDQQAAPAKPVTKTEITGSHVKRDVRRIGRTADTPFPVIVIDRQEIGRSGAVSACAFCAHPATRISATSSCIATSTTRPSTSRGPSSRSRPNTT